MKKTLTAQSFFAGKNKIVIIGLGYVGLPLAAHLSRHFKVIGYDILNRKQQVQQELIIGVYNIYTS